MFSTSLRRRSSTTALVPLLTSRFSEISFATPLRESNVQTHDISIPLPNNPTAATGAPKTRVISDDDSSNQSLPQLRVLVFTLSSIENKHAENVALSRIERFESLAREGDHAIILFLLSSLSQPKAPTLESLGSLTFQPDDRTTSPMQAFARLQTLLASLRHAPSPLLPIPALESLLPILSTYVSNLTPPIPPSHPSAPTKALSLLAHATSNRSGLLEEKTIFVLSDTCRNLKDVVQAVQGSVKRGDAERGVREGRDWRSRGVEGGNGRLGSEARLEGSGREEGVFRLEEWISGKEREGMEGFWVGDGGVGG